MSPPSDAPVPTDAAAENTALPHPQDPDLTSDSTPDTSPADQSKGQSALQVFASTFATIFLAELGDKTQVTTLLMSAESHKPWIVFAGAGSALVATSLLGVLLGRWLATRLSPRTLERGAGITLLLITAGLVWDIYSGF